MFPRHVLEVMTKDSLLGDSDKHLGTVSWPLGGASNLAQSHENVTIMFMDIVGFTTMSKEVQPVEVR